MRLAALALLIAAIAASPQINFPISSQFPPVARVGEPYKFQFASTTFQPDPNKLQYSLVGSPQWLHINSGDRTLWGTPGPGDAGSATFTIAAAGEAGAVANMDSKLLVEQDEGPKLNGNISEQLSKAGQLSGPSSIILLPSKPFEINFAPDTFQADGKSLSYNATLADHTSLPSWISFNPQSLRFAGTTPPSPSPQSFKILLIASDTPGFATASLTFTLNISAHQLLFKPSLETINFPKGERVEINGLKAKVFLDGAPIRDEDIMSAHADLPPWLSFDDKSFDVTGQPPPALMSQDVNITVQDNFGDSTQYSIHLTFNSQLFTTEVGQLNVTAGRTFVYKIPKTILTETDEDVSADLGKLGKWLTFNKNTLTIQGTVPKDGPPGTMNASLTATSSDGKMKDTQTFQMQVSGTEQQPTSGGTPTNPISNDTNESGDSSSAHSVPSDKKRSGVIVGSVISALFAAIILLVFVCFLCRRKKNERGYVSPKSPRSPRKTDISRPILIAEQWEEIDRARDIDLEAGKKEVDSLERTPEHAPRLDLDLAMKRKDSASPASSLGEPEDEILTSFNSSSWGFHAGAGPSHRPHDSMRIPTEMARKESASSAMKHKKYTIEPYRNTQRHISELPVNRRLTNLAHRRHTYSPSRSNNNLATLHRSCSSSSFTTATNSMSLASTVPSAFPQPPTARHTTQLTTPKEKRRSIRLVPASTWDSLLDRRTIDEKRNSYIRKRASAQSPFFGADPSRFSSSSHRFSTPGGTEFSPVRKFALTPLSTNIVKPGDDIVEEKNKETALPESLRIKRPSETASLPINNARNPPSLRKNRPNRTFMRRHTEAQAATNAANPDRVEKVQARPGTAVYSRTVIGRRSSQRQSLRAAELKSSLNSLTNSKIFEDAELSESVYSTEEEDIEEYERRTTVKPDHYVLPPLKLNVNKSKESNKRDNKRGSKREMKRLSQRDPTPYSLALEHGGKENHSSTYSLTKPAPTVTTSPSKSKGKAKAVPSPERPKTSYGTRPSHHSRVHSRATNRSSAQRSSQGQPLSRIPSNKERHSRRSIHSQSASQSRQSVTGPGKKTRDRSRTQSSAYPYFDASSTLTETGKTSQATSGRPRRGTGASERDPSGNIANYALHESPKIEQLDRNSIALRTSNGRLNPTAQNSPLAQLHTSPFYHAKRDTAVPSPSSRVPSRSIGLGLSLPDNPPEGADKTSALDATGTGVGMQRERTPLSLLHDGNGSSPERVRRTYQGKGKGPVRSEASEESAAGAGGVGATGEGRKTWGSLRGVLGRSGGNFWGGKDVKAFL